MGKILLEKATSISAGEFPKLVTCKWPLGRVTLYQDRIILDARIEKYELLFSEIEHFQFNIFQVNIEHHNPNVIKDIDQRNSHLQGHPASGCATSIACKDHMTRRIWLYETGLIGAVYR